MEESPRRRHTTRSDARKLMADALKASARSTAEIRSSRTFKVSNFRIPEFVVIVCLPKKWTRKTRRKVRKNKVKGSKEGCENKTHEEEFYRKTEEIT